MIRAGRIRLVDPRVCMRIRLVNSLYAMFFGASFMKKRKKEKEKTGLLSLNQLPKLQQQKISEYGSFSCPGGGYVTPSATYITKHAFTTFMIVRL